MTRHASDGDLDDLFEGRLTGAASEAWMHHLAGCDDCFERFDRRWRTAFPGAPELPLFHLGPAVAGRLERVLFTRIHRASLADCACRLGSDGFLAVVLILLRPFLPLERFQSLVRKGDQR